MQNSIRGVLIDVSGTVHVGDKAIPGAANALDRLRDSGIPFRFCTNTTQSSGDTLAEKLKKLGLNVNREEIFTSLSACRQMVKSRGLRPLLLLEPDARQEFEGIEHSEPHDSVVVGLSPSSFQYDVLNKAFRLLIESKSTPQPATLVAVHKAKYFADGADQGRLSMGPGGFVEALEYASGIKAHVVGKPQKAFFELAIQNMGLALQVSTSESSSHSGSSGIVMIGDDVEQDLGGGAAELGLIRYLVQTGKYRAKDEDRDVFGGLDGTFKDFSAAVDHILSSYHK
ncbi:Haloacid dehalogenase-like hydrolase domain-containing protein 2 [Lobosporangium transversale]|uniref:Haloacid dehalogenase-like hydrolase domain-containing protein 2 n=1 Tax=Lobosporangium transversale TaxID=64571 RepID=A0A1Y2H2D6_9FUNG|nr:HAD-like domain-containing protein [Lobosporangium transversale]KAF9907293.1 Haloacid dehalogenase-like hydrolase domain-containing protein 2 [Lobosporangium transversale]ORZ28717.1 HAD-like domain-containing protein [Lobosporangium transversale]|eukprot:XP_021886390.1 HAD-like domain-containing protein [Lobosporangium transversale]